MSDSERDEFGRRAAAYGMDRMLGSPRSLPDPLRALDRLLDVALQNSGQARRVRRVLLACYNAPEWPLDLSDLRGLDLDLAECALSVIVLFASGAGDFDQYRPEAPWQAIWDLACREADSGDRTQ